MREGIFEALKVELLKTAYDKTKCFALGGATYRAYPASYTVFASWRGKSEIIASLGYARSKGFKMSRSLELNLTYEVDLYPRDLAKVINNSLAEIWGIEEDVSYLARKVMPLICPYIFENVFNLEYDPPAFRFFIPLFVRYVASEKDSNYKFKISKVRLRNQSGESLNLKDSSGVKLDTLIYKIYETSIFSIDLYVAQTLAYLVMDIGVKLLQEFESAATRDPIFIFLKECIE